MKFIVKEKSLPKHGETRVVKKFLFFPKKIKNEVRWLEFANILSVWVINHDWIEEFDDESFNDLGWNEVKFLEKE